LGKFHSSLESGFSTVSNYITSKKTEEAVEQQEAQNKKDSILKSLSSSGFADDE
jgi:predicted transcriptional regulator